MDTNHSGMNRSDAADNFGVWIIKLVTDTILTTIRKDNVSTFRTGRINVNGRMYAKIYSTGETALAAIGGTYVLKRWWNRWCRYHCGFEWNARCAV